MRIFAPRPGSDSGRLRGSRGGFAECGEEIQFEGRLERGGLLVGIDRLEKQGRRRRGSGIHEEAIVRGRKRRFKRRRSSDRASPRG